MESPPLIILYKFGPGFGLRETGPFVLKVMAYMRLTGIDFTETVQGDPRKAPKRKIPYISDEGELCLLYTSPSPRDRTRSRMPSSA